MWKYGVFVCVCVTAAFESNEGVSVILSPFSLTTVGTEKHVAFSFSFFLFFFINYYTFMFDHQTALSLSLDSQFQIIKKIRTI